MVGRHAKKNQQKKRMRLTFTKEGKWFVWITLAIGFAAINTGNNLLFLLLGMMLSLIVVSGLLCNMSLNRLSIQRYVPRKMFASTPCLISFSVTNQKRYFPSFSIQLEDSLSGLEQGKMCYFLKIPSGETQTASYHLSLDKRGLHHFTEVKLASQFPFSLFLKTKVVPLEEDCLVFPELFPVVVPSAISQQSIGLVSSGRRGQGSDFFALREMQPGDEPRWIHWPSSVKSNSFQVREFEDEHRLEIELVLWNVLPQKQLSLTETEEHFDRAVSFAASLLEAFFRQRQPVRFATAKQHFFLTEQTSSFLTILNHLALVEIEGEEISQLPRHAKDSPFLVIVPDGFSVPRGVSPKCVLRTAKRAA